MHGLSDLSDSHRLSRTLVIDGFDLPNRPSMHCVLWLIYSVWFCCVPDVSTTRPESQQFAQHPQQRTYSAPTGLNNILFAHSGFRFLGSVLPLKPS